MKDELELRLTPELEAHYYRALKLLRAVKNLLVAARTSGGTAGPDAGLMKACDEAEAVVAEIRGVATPSNILMREALEPFAKIADKYDNFPAHEFRDDGQFAGSTLGWRLTFGDLRKARAAYQSISVGGGVVVGEQQNQQVMGGPSGNPLSPSGSSPQAVSPAAPLQSGAGSE